MWGSLGATAGAVSFFVGITVGTATADVAAAGGGGASADGVESFLGLAFSGAGAGEYMTGFRTPSSSSGLGGGDMADRAGGGEGNTGGGTVF